MTGMKRAYFTILFLCCLVCVGSEETVKYSPEAAFGIGRCFCGDYFKSGDKVIVGTQQNDSMIVIYNTNDWTIDRVVAKVTNAADILKIKLSPDEKYVIVLYSSNLGNYNQVFSVETGELIFTFKLNGYAYNLYAIGDFSPDSKRIVVPNDWNKIAVYDISSKSFLYEFESLNTTPKAGSPVYSSDGNYVFCGYNNLTFRLWDVESKSTVYTSPSYLESGQSEAIPDEARAIPGTNRFLVSTNLGQIFIFDTLSSEYIKKYTGAATSSFNHYLSNLQINADSTKFLYMPSPDSSCVIYDIETGGIEKTFAFNYSAPGFAVDDSWNTMIMFPYWSDNGIVKLSETIKMIDINSGTQIREIKSPVFYEKNAISGDGKTLVSAYDCSNIQIWNTLRGSGLSLNLEGQNKSNPVMDIAFSYDSSTIAILKKSEEPSEKNEILLIDAVSGALLAEFQEPAEYKINKIELSPDASKVLFCVQEGSSYSVKMLETKNWTLLRTYLSSRKITFVRYSPDGEGFVTIDNGLTANIILWDSEITTPVNTFICDYNGGMYMQYSTDAGRLLVQYDTGVAVYDTQTYVKLFQKSGVRTSGAGFTADGKYLLQKVKKFTGETYNYPESCEGRLFDIDANLHLKTFASISSNMNSNVYFSADRTALFAFNGSIMEVHSTGLTPLPLIKDPAVLLKKDIPYSGNISEGKYKDFYTTVTAGLNMIVELEPQSSDTKFSLYSRFGEEVIFQYYDQKSDAAAPDGKIRIIISPTESGAYYFKVAASKTPTDGVDYSITVKTPDKFLADVYPRVSGKSTKATFNIKGAGLNSASGFELRKSGSAAIAAIKITSISDTESLAEFNLISSDSGDYSLAAIWGSEESILSNSVSIQDLEPGKIEVEIDAPPVFRANRKYCIHVNYSNTGGTEILSPVLIIKSNPEIEMRALWMENFTKGKLAFLATQSIMPTGIIMPGQAGSVTIEVKTLNIPDIKFSIEKLEMSNDAVNWDDYKDLMKPEKINEAEWEINWDAYKVLFGNSFSSYLSVLGEYSGRIFMRGQDPHSINLISNLIFNKSAGNPHAALCGKAFNSETSTPIKAAVIKAVTADGEIGGAAYTDREGGFVIKNLQDGDYTLIIEGYRNENLNIYTVTNQKDVTGIIRRDRIFIQASEEIADEIKEFSGSPAVAADQTGKLFAVFENTYGIKYSCFDGDNWSVPAMVSSEKGISPKVAYSPALTIDGITTGGLVAVWGKTNDQTSALCLNFVVGRISGTHVDWSSTQTLTMDANSDYGHEVIIDDNGTPVVVWQQKNQTIQDDDDIYYEELNLSDIFLKSKEIDKENSAVCFKTDKNLSQKTLTGSSFIFQKNMDCPNVPLLHNEKFLFYSNYPALEGDYVCNPKLTGYFRNPLISIHGEKFWGEKNLFAYPLFVSLESKSVNNKCEYVLKHAFSSSKTFKIKSKTGIIKEIPVIFTDKNFKKVYSEYLTSIIDHQFDAEWYLSWNSGTIRNDMLNLGPITNGSSSPEFKYNISYTMKLYSKNHYSEITGTASLPFIYNPVEYKYDLSQFKMEIISQDWPVNNTNSIKVAWYKKWPMDAEPVNPPGDDYEVAQEDITSEYMTYDNYWKTPEFSSHSQIEFTKKKTFSGTGNKYEKESVLSDISSDYYGDSKPVLAKNSGGSSEIYAAWAKEHNNINEKLGSKVIGISYKNGSWDSSYEIIDPNINYNQDLSVIIDKNGNKHAVWSQAPSTHSINDNIKDIMQDMDNKDIVYSKSTSPGTWSAPVKISEITSGKNTQPQIAVSDSNDILVTYVNSGVAGEDKLFSSKVSAGDTAFSTPEQIASGKNMRNSSLSWNQNNTFTSVCEYIDAMLEKSSIYYQQYNNTSDTWSEIESLYNLFGRNAKKITDSKTYLLPGTDIRRIAEVFSNVSYPFSENKTGSVNPKSGFYPDTSCCEEDYEDTDEYQEMMNTLDTQLLEEEISVNIRPHDPNEKYSTAGPDSLHTIKAGDTITYMIKFENVSTATAPAQEVFIVDYLDSNLDISTLKTLEAGFGSQNVPIYTSERTFIKRISIDNSQYIVDISFNMDIDTGRLQWTFRTLDPETEDYPVDDLAGFLPPNDDSGRGEGYIAFSVKSKSDTPQRSVIKNKATIIFDSESAITTNETTNFVSEISLRDISDMVLLKNTSMNPDELDINNDGNVDISDIMKLINYAH